MKQYFRAKCAKCEKWREITFPLADIHSLHECGSEMVEGATIKEVFK